MKIIASLILASTALLWGCSTTYYNYTQYPVNTYMYDNGIVPIKGELSPQYFELGMLQPISLLLRFSHNLVRAENLKSIEVRLFTQDRSGQYTKEIPRAASEITVAYWNGKNETRISRENYTGEFHSLIEPTMKNYPYRESHIVGFEVENEYTGLEHPEKIQQKIIIQWMDKPEEVFTSILTKTMHSKECISGRPFG